MGVQFGLKYSESGRRKQTLKKLELFIMSLMLQAEDILKNKKIKIEGRVQFAKNRCIAFREQRAWIIVPFVAVPLRKRLAGWPTDNSYWLNFAGQLRQTIQYIFTRQVRKVSLEDACQRMISLVCATRGCIGVDGEDRCKPGAGKAEIEPTR